MFFAIFALTVYIDILTYLENLCKPNLKEHKIHLICFVERALTNGQIKSSIDNFKIEI